MKERKKNLKSQCRKKDKNQERKKKEKERLGIQEAKNEKQNGKKEVKKLNEH